MYRELYFNIEAANKLGLEYKTDLIDLGLLNYLYWEVNRFIRVNEDLTSQKYVNVNFSHIISSCPYLGIKTIESLSARIRRLENLGLIIINDLNDNGFNAAFSAAIELREIFIAPAVHTDNIKQPIDYSSISTTVIADILLKEEQILDTIRFINKYITDNYELTKPESLTKFLDIYTGVILRECEINGMKTDCADISVYDPKSIKVMRYMVNIIYNAIHIISEVLNEIQSRLNDEQLRDLLMEYVKSSCFARIKNGIYKLSIAELAQLETQKIFKDTILEYTSEQKPHYFVKMVLRCNGSNN
ncbi:hypothetical protein MCHI_001941 [Candidatus Magnetoovum chiemensis]|nr:hypothetical protein MCHI_001941 [Candidatus Magnetoovum chiemensis]